MKLSTKLCMTRSLKLVLLLAAVLAALPTQAREARRMTPIARPGALPADARRPPRVEPISHAAVEQAVRDVALAWNSGQLSELLAADMQDAGRLRDTLAEVLPRDARLTVLSVQGVSTLDQYLQGDKRLSTVLAVVRTQVEFNDPRVGYKRLEGLNQWTFRVEE